MLIHFWTPIFINNDVIKLHKIFQGTVPLQLKGMKVKSINSILVKRKASVHQMTGNMLKRETGNDIHTM
jgi:hypothetical protein